MSPAADTLSPRAHATAAASASSVVLAIPTFRRPEGLRKLLTHVGELNYPGALSVIVVDNDAELSAGAGVVAEMMRTFPFSLTCIVEPRRGQTYAYNRGFVAAARALPGADYVAILDDDEYPERAWLTAMVTAAAQFDADIVGGPVLPVFDDPHHWLANSGFYQPLRYPTGRVDMIYGVGSMLIRRRVLEDYLEEPFSHAFAFTGGSDLEFFTRCRRDGRSFAWADAAIVSETTPCSRTTVSWLLRRNFRKGSERVRIERLARMRLTERVRRWCRSLALLALGAGALPLAALAGRVAVVGSLNRLARGVGGVAAEFNIFYDEYR